MNKEGFVESMETPAAGSEKTPGAVKFFYYNREIESKEILDDFKTNELIPATLEEINDPEFPCPDLPKELRIFALGSSKEENGKLLNPFLLGYKEKGERKVEWAEVSNLEDCLFAAVCPKKAKIKGKT